MAESFIGMTVSVKLKPPHTPPLLIGKVQSIQGQLLVLNHVFLPFSGQSAPVWNISSDQIADLEVTDSHAGNTQPQPQPQSIISPSKSQHAPQRQPAAPQAMPQTPVKAPMSGLVPSSVKPTVAVNGPLVSAAPATSAAAIAQAFSQVQTGKKGKGWRQTPLLEPVTQQTKELPIRSTPSAKKKSRRARDEQQAQQSGWATEEVTDVQDLPDFDFVGNLSKFDKKAVFDELRQEDMTAEGDRLVSHNRLARPGTNGGKNLHPTDMVLSPPSKPHTAHDHLQSDDSSDLDLANGRSSRQSLRSRPRSNLPPERKFSGAGDDGSSSRPLRAMSSQQRPMNASVLSSNSRNRSTSSFVESRAPQTGPHLYISSTGRRCPVISPERLAQAAESYSRVRGLSAATLTELTAAAIARSITRLCVSQPSSRRNSRPMSRSKPVIVILCGNHRRGALALAAARHLMHRPYRLLISVADYMARDWHPDFGTQHSLLEDTKLHPNEWPVILGQIKQLSSPPALIVDALLDGTDFASVVDVQTGLEARDCIDWCNRSRAPVVSLGIPSGHDQWTGETTMREGEPVSIRAGRVLALGGVFTGVLQAMTEGEKWAVEVLDVGLEGMLGKNRIGFDGEWWLEADMVTGE